MVKEACFTAKEVRAAPFNIDVLGGKFDLPKIDVASPLINVALGNDGIDIARKRATSEPVTATVTTRVNRTAPKVGIAGVTGNGDRVNFIDNLTLGDRVDSKDTTRIPLDLAFAWLRHSMGMIDLGLPVQGSLDDPQFRRLMRWP